jgi:two-component system sensor histidine kinase KdpD
MLGEGRRLSAAGADVIVGYLEVHDEDDAAALLDGLVVVPPKPIGYRGLTFAEMDIDAILLRRPRIVLVDELAHTNAPGQRHAKRWQDVEELLDAGIDVISNVNVQHLDSLHETVERMTGVAQRETVPDDVIAMADRIDLVDLDADALRERVRRRGAVRSADPDSPLERWFTNDNLDALHDLAADWIARHADATNFPIAVDSASTASVVVSLDAGRAGDQLVRRAAQIAHRSHAQLIGVHVRVPSGLAEPMQRLDSRRRLLAELGGRYAEVGALDRGDGVIRFAQAQGAAELVVGAQRRPRLQRLIHGAQIDRLVEAAAGTIELHVISLDNVPEVPLTATAPTRRDQFSARRRLVAWLVAVIGPFVVAVGLTPWRASLGLGGALLALLLITAATAAVGGLVPSLIAAALAFASADFLYAPPLHSFRIDHLVDLVGLLTFAGVAVLVSILVDQLARSSLQATQGRAEAAGVTRLAATALRSAVCEQTALLDELRTVFQLDSVALMTRDNRGWSVVRAVGDPVPSTPDDGATSISIGPNSVLVVTGGGLPEQGSPLLRELVAEFSRTDARSQLDRLRTGPGND